MENEICREAIRPFHFSRADVQRLAAQRRWPKAVICRVREHDRVPGVDEVLAQRVKNLIDVEPYLGYRMVWARLRRQDQSEVRAAVDAAQGLEVPPTAHEALFASGREQPQRQDGFRRALEDRCDVRLDVSTASFTSTPFWTAPIASASG